MIKYNNSLYTTKLPELEERTTNLEELIMNHEPTSMVQDDYRAFGVYEMNNDEFMEWASEMEKYYLGSE